MAFDSGAKQFGLVLVGSMAPVIRWGELQHIANRLASFRLALAELERF